MKSQKRVGYTTTVACAGASACEGHWWDVEQFIRSVPTEELRKLFHGAGCTVEQAVQTYRKFFQECTQNKGCMLLTYYGDAVVAVGTLLPLRETKKCELNFIVLHDYQKDGIASAMLRRLLVLARERGFWRAYVETDRIHAAAMQRVIRNITGWERTVVADGDEKVYIFNTTPTWEELCKGIARAWYMLYLSTLRGAWRPQRRPWKVI